MTGDRSVEGTAESIPLAPASVDLITAAQAFHWFEVDAARAWPHARTVAVLGRPS